MPLFDFLKPRAATGLARAFPRSMRREANAVSRVVSSWTDPAYRSADFTVRVEGEQIHIPQRLNMHNPGGWRWAEASTEYRLARCLETRSTDGYQRQAALQSVLGANQPWSIPFVVALVGEYVVEILDDIDRNFASIDPALLRGFLLDNPGYLALTRARVMSYWNAYYRHQCARRDYVGFRVLERFDAVMPSADPARPATHDMTKA